MSDKVHNLELLAKESESLAIAGDLKQGLVLQLAEIGERIPSYEAEAKTFQCLNAHDAAHADSQLAAINADLKAVNDKSGVLARITKAAHDFHRRMTGFGGEFTTPLEAVKAKYKRERDDFDRREAAKAEAERQRLQAIEDERIRKIRQAEEQKAATQRKIEEDARREAEQKRREAEQASAAERKKLQEEADKLERQAETARVRAEVREEKAATQVATVINVAVPVARKGARPQVYVESIDLALLLPAIAKDPSLHGLIDADALKEPIARMRRANSTYALPGVTFSVRTI